MKPNTSNDFNDDGEEMLYNDGFKQGYAKSLDDVTKILNELCLKCPIQDDKECWCKPLEIALKEIAKLEKK